MPIRRLALGPELADGSRPIVILFADTAVEETQQLIPAEQREQLPPRRRTVARVTLVFEGDIPELSEEALTQPPQHTTIDSQGKVVVAEGLRSLPPAVRSGSGEAKTRSGGLALPPTSAQSSTRQFVLFNTGEKGEFDDSNATHAERQLRDWFLHRVNTEWKKAIKGIKININWSPCRACVDDLIHLQSLLPHLERAEITFPEIYTGATLGTRPQDLDRLSKYWLVKGPPLLERAVDRRGRIRWRLT